LAGRESLISRDFEPAPVRHAGTAEPIDVDPPDGAAGYKRAKPLIALDDLPLDINKQTRISSAWPCSAASMAVGCYRTSSSAFASVT
jgi:hypothetical protein